MIDPESFVVMKKRIMLKSRRVSGLGFRLMKKRIMLKRRRGRITRIRVRLRMSRSSCRRRKRARF